MSTLLLLSVVIAMIAIPVLVARDRDAASGWRKVIFLMFVFNLFYLLAVRFIYPRLR